MSKCIDRTDRIALYLDRRIGKQKVLSDLVTKILNIISEEGYNEQVNGKGE